MHIKEIVMKTENIYGNEYIFNSFRYQFTKVVVLIFFFPPWRSLVKTNAERLFPGNFKLLSQCDVK